MEGNIAIDGPAGAGKSTVAKLLAQKIGYIYIDTGAMYRAITWKALSKGIDITDYKKLVDLALETEIIIKKINGQQRVLCDGEDITDDIRTPEISQNVSFVAQVPGIREKLQKDQRQMAKNNNVVMDGRDIATKVLPDARYKFYLTASVEERAQRRYQELLAKGYLSNLETIKNEIMTRDRLDRERVDSPLIKAADAIEINTTKMTINEVVNKILEHLRR